MRKEIILPQLGETMNDGTIASWRKQVGDRVEKGDLLCEVETDKAVLEVESPAPGYLAQILAPVGKTIPVLQVIAYIVEEQNELAAQIAPTQLAEGGVEGIPHQPNIQSSPSAPTSLEPGMPISLTPSAKRVAKEHGINVSMLRGTGPNGRIVENDVWDYIRNKTNVGQVPAATMRADGKRLDPLAAAPEPSGSKEAEWDLLPLTRIRRITAEKLSQSYHDAVHVTLHAEVDMTEAAKLRTRLMHDWSTMHGVNVTFTDLVVKAVANALVDHRNINASFTPEGIHLYRHINVGVAVSVSNGLIVPVLRDADRLKLLQICTALRSTGDRARSGQINPDELHGGTITVTNMGMMGVESFTPIINGPEGVILGVGRMADKPAVHGGQLTIRPLMWLSLSFDHRLIDGAGAASFLAQVKHLLENPDLILPVPVVAITTPMAKQEIIEKAYSLAYENEQKYGCCPQCVLAAIQDTLGIVDDGIFKASHTLAGGGGLTTGGTCGALSGGMLALGAKFGRRRADFGTGTFLESYKLGKQLCDQFVAEFGSPICAEVQRNLLGRSFDMWDRKDFTAFEEAGGHRDKCPRVAGKVASWTAEMLIGSQHDDPK